MSRAEYKSYLKKISYGTMGDFSVFREEKHKETQTDSEKTPQQK